jgi:hypothetical protein
VVARHFHIGTSEKDPSFHVVSCDESLVSRLDTKDIPEDTNEVRVYDAYRYTYDLDPF